MRSWWLKYEAVVAGGFFAFALAGCAEAPVKSGAMPQVMFLRGHYPPPSSLPSTRPTIRLVRLTEVFTSENYRSDPTYLGPRFVSDLPRVDAVRSAILAHLEKAGVRAEYQPEDIPNGPPTTAGGSLQLSVEIRRFEVLQESPYALKAAVVLDCLFTRQGRKTLLWHGASEGRDDKVLVSALDQAVDKCVTPAVEFANQARRETYATLLETIRATEAIGDRGRALSLYVQAYRVALEPEQKAVVLGAMGRLARTSLKPSLPEEARRLGVQAGVLVQERRYPEAIEKYAAALDLAPWWAEAHFNEALIQAEEGRYAKAIESMKRFIALTPDSPDARVAQDKIYEWEVKVK